MCGPFAHSVYITQPDDLVHWISTDAIVNRASNYFLSSPAHVRIVTSILAPLPSPSHRDYSFNLDMCDLFAFDPFLANLVMLLPVMFIEVMQDAMVVAQRTMMKNKVPGTIKGDMYTQGVPNFANMMKDTASTITLTRIHASLTNLPPFDDVFIRQLSSITSQSVGKMVQVRKPH